MAVSNKCCGGRRNVKELLVHDSLNEVRKSSLSTGSCWDSPEVSAAWVGVFSCLGPLVFIIQNVRMLFKCCSSLQANQQLEAFFPFRIKHFSF